MSMFFGKAMMSREQAVQAASDTLQELDDNVTVWYGEGHSGPGWYAWVTEYGEEGSVLLADVGVD